jgi:cyclase
MGNSTFKEFCKNINMLRPRIIPCLLIKNGGLVKSVQFDNYKYVGDPINAVKIFNEKEVDEIIILDIDATVYNKEPNYKLIESLAAESRMPLCYGGGVKTVEQAQKIFSLGVEKVSISSEAVSNPNLITEISNRVGSQSIVVILDVKKNKLGEYEIWTHNATKNTMIDPVAFANEVQRLGAGEVVVNSIDEDGIMKGYDLELIEKIRNVISLPLTVLGGAGTLKDIEKLISKYKVIGVAAGSLFVFKGVFKAVLINYPNSSEKARMLSENL